jgi:phage gpG-like protein
MPASQLLSHLRAALETPDTLVQKVGEDAVLPGIQANIDRGNFAPLKQATLAHKTGFAPLKESGRLYGSLAPGAPDNVSEVSGSTGHFGTAVPYAADLDSGTSAMPARPFMVVSNAMAEDALDTLSDALFS